MELWQAALLGVVEGLTEFLPVSSTGHLILSTQLLDIDSPGGAFEIIIQSGAVLAVLWHYRTYLTQLLLQALQGQTTAWRRVGHLALGTVPAVVLALSLGSLIKEHLFGLLPVAWALVVGGICLVLVERRRGTERGAMAVSTWQQALGIGLFQCLALWPGTSRSMATILGGRLLGLSAGAAAEFSFLLAIPVLLGACVYDLLKHGPELAASGIGPAALALGIGTSFVTALLVIRAFLGWVQLHSLEVFGWYRIVLGALLFWLVL